MLRSRIFLIIFLVIIAALVITIAGMLSVYQEPGFLTETKRTEARQDLFFSYEITRYPARVELIDVSNSTENITLGVNVETYNIDFGVIPAKGGKSTKHINLTAKEGSSKVVLKAYGTIKGMISFEDNNFLLGGKRSIAVSAQSNEKSGVYSGEIDIIVQKSRFTLLKQMLGY